MVPATGCVAKAAISQSVRIARCEREVLAVPVHVAFSKISHSAPGSIAKGSAGRSSKQWRRRKSSDTNYQFRRGFQHGPLLWLHGAGMALA
jgi:hypothetical protein